MSPCWEEIRRFDSFELPSEGSDRLDFSASASRGVVLHLPAAAFYGFFTVIPRHALHRNVNRNKKWLSRIMQTSNI